VVSRPGQGGFLRFPCASYVVMPSLSLRRGGVAHRSVFRYALLSSPKHYRLDPRDPAFRSYLCVHSRYGLTTRGYPDDTLVRWASEGSFPPPLPPQLPGSDFSPGGTVSSPTEHAGLHRTHSAKAFFKISRSISTCLSRCRSCSTSNSASDWSARAVRRQWWSRLSLIPSACATERTDCPWRTIVSACRLNSSSYLRRTVLACRTDELEDFFFMVVSLIF